MKRHPGTRIQFTRRSRTFAASFGSDSHLRNQGSGLIKITGDGRLMLLQQEHIHAGKANASR